MARKRNVTVDTTVFDSRVRKLAKRFKVDELKFVKEQTEMLAREVAKFTPPYATFPSGKGLKVATGKDIQAGKLAVFYDIRQICTVKPKGEITKAKKSWKGQPIRRGNKVISLGIIDDLGQLEAWHKRNKGFNGRTKPLMGANRYWVSQPVFNKYVKAEQRKVGAAKAAFLKASISLGGKGAAPANVKNNLPAASGSGAMTKTNKGWVGNIRGRAGGLFHTNRHLPRIRKDRLTKAVRRLWFVSKAAAKEAGFKVN